MNNYEPIIGLEVHVELATGSKMFCGCSTDYFGAKPNTHTCPICLGLPGAMPSANKTAIEYAQILGLALNCKVSLSSKFDRKNYFYPDLAKGFQISQYDLPLSEGGFVLIPCTSEESKPFDSTQDEPISEVSLMEKMKKIDITRAHLEEDTAKLMHQKSSLVDFNRSGVPLIEIVSEPDMNSAGEAKAYAQKLQQIVRYLKISDADMEKGSMRIEPNISLGEITTDNEQLTVDRLPNYKVELKNINSFKFAEKAINYEIARQTEVLESGRVPLQETRGWDEFKNRTFSQRSKEEAHDYRYFPEPDLPPMVFDKSYISRLSASLCELPDEKAARFTTSYGLNSYDIEILTRERETAEFFEEAVKVGSAHNLTAKQIANYLINKKPNIKEVLPAGVIQNMISISKTAQIDKSVLEKAVKQVLSENPKAIGDYKKGKESVIMFLIGQVVGKLKQKADINMIKEILEKELRK